MKSWPANDYRQSSGLLIDRFGETITQQSEAAQFEGHCCLTVESSHKENERAISIAEEGFSSCFQALLTLGRRSGSLVSAKHSIDPDACRCERKIGVSLSDHSVRSVIITWLRATHLECWHRADDCACRDPRAGPRWDTCRPQRSGPCRCVLIEAPAVSSPWATCRLSPRATVRKF